MTAPPTLLITADDALAGELLRLAAAAGVPLEVRPDPPEALPLWAGAPAVLVGGDQAARLAAAAPPRRDEVHLVGLGTLGDPLFRAAVTLGAASVLELPDAEAWLVQLLTDVGEEEAAGLVLGVLPGSGGVGASVLAAGLAATAGRRAPTLLVDLDPLGPGAHRLLGLDTPGDVTWRELVDSPGRLGSRALREAVPRQGAVGVLGWPSESAGTRPGPETVREVVSAGARGHRLVVLDLPRTVDDANASVLSRCGHVVVVVGARTGSAASAARLCAWVRTHARSPGLVVRTRRPSPLSGDLAEVLGLPLLAELGDQRRLEEHLDLGLGPVHARRGPVLTTCEGLLDRLGFAR